ncbi:MAG: secretin N-terminal domain-containing protein [Holosporaceae bacterium]|jgi:general secretion pathway protein D|nr:secretin N-terminal domain-containing protein [Holosporaceae bacterium]
MARKDALGRSLLLLSCLLLLSGCYNLEEPRVPQQKGMDHCAFDLLATPVDDFLQDINISYANEPSDTDKTASINENFRKSISISVSEKMQMREVLTQMANLAGVNIFIAQDIEGNISFTAKDRPFLDILRDICSCAHLKYFINGNSVKIEYDSPTLRTYTIPSLNIQRDTISSMSISTDIFSGDTNSFTSNGGDSSVNEVRNNGSCSSISGTAKNDFWTELENTLKTIVGDADGNYVTIHRQGGLVSACTTQEKHEEIQQYLALLKEASEAQVLIEAKILEVNLKDEFKSGINWHILRGGGAMMEKYFDRDGLFSAGINRNSLSIVSAFIEKFGAVKTLSSPRVTILNNHSAVFKVAKNEVIYLPEFHKQYSGTTNPMNTDLLSANVKTIPIGLVMTVHPSIDRKNNTIILTLRPTISKIASYKEVPFLFHNYSRISASGGTTSLGSPQTQMQKIPIVDVRELDSVLKLRSGQIAVMGGLMDEKSINYREGLPGMEDTPIDFVSGSREKSSNVTELVIFVRATILNNKDKMYHGADEKIYNKFSSEPRLLRFQK